MDVFNKSERNICIAFGIIVSMEARIFEFVERVTGAIFIKHL